MSWATRQSQRSAARDPAARRHAESGQVAKDDDDAPWLGSRFGASDGAQLRALAIAQGKIRPAGSVDPVMRSIALPLDAAGIRTAADELVATAPRVRVREIAAGADGVDPRVAREVARRIP